MLLWDKRRNCLWKWSSFKKLQNSYSTGCTSRVVQLAHEGHQGIVKTKMLLHEKVWFPGIDPLVENTIKSCISCQASASQNHIEPYKMSQLPKVPWTEVSVDFCGPFPTEYLMVVVDEYTCYPIVQILKSVSHRCVIPWLDQMFLMFSVSEVVKLIMNPHFQVISSGTLLAIWDFIIAKLHLIGSEPMLKLKVS